MATITKENAKYFYKSKYCYRLTWYTLLWVVLYTQIARPLNINAIVNAVLTTLPALALLIMVPMGIFYSIKSYVNKEPYNKYRTFYLIGHIFFMLMIIAFAVSIFLDINKFTHR